MIRTLGAMVAAALLLSACGSISASKAMVSWVAQNGYLASARLLLSDAQHAASALEKPSTSDAGLHTVCGVLLVDTETANATLPAPDSRATKLLSAAYTNLGAGANECYNASASVSARTKAIKSLALGVGDLSEGSARIASASTP